MTRRRCLASLVLALAAILSEVRGQTTQPAATDAHPMNSATAPDAPIPFFVGT
jgi:hypothetical protein